MPIKSTFQDKGVTYTDAYHRIFSYENNIDEKILKVGVKTYSSEEYYNSGGDPLSACYIALYEDDYSSVFPDMDTASSDIDQWSTTIQEVMTQRVESILLEVDPSEHTESGTDDEETDTAYNARIAKSKFKFNFKNGGAKKI